MALQFIKKRFRKTPERVMVPQTQKTVDTVPEPVMAMPQVDDEVIENKKNNKKKNKKDMFDKERINDIEAVVEQLQPEVKVVKADRGLIERTESSKIIITEDNRQVLND